MSGMLNVSLAAGCEQRALSDASVSEEVQEAADPVARVSIGEILLQISLQQVEGWVWVDVKCSSGTCACALQSI